MTIYRQHLYELAGFRELLPPAFLAQIMEGPWEKMTGPVDLPRIDLELRRTGPSEALRGLAPVGAEVAEAALRLQYRSPDGLIAFGFELHFNQERLIFDLESGLRVRDDGSAQAARNIVDVLRFQLDYICNGELHLYNADTRGLLSRVDAFMPINCWANQDWFAAESAKWQAVADERAAAPAGQDPQWPDQKTR